MSFASLPCFLFAVTLAITAVGCGGDGDADPNVGDPLANEEVVRCDMPADHVCREYNRGHQGKATAFVDLPAARKACGDGWPGGALDGGTFSAGSCSQEDALGRCATQTHTLPMLTTFDYFYSGFGDGTATLEGLAGACANIEKNAPEGSEVTSVFETPPF